MTRRQWVLAVLAAAEGEAVTPVQLQKSLFLLEQRHPEIGKRAFYKFTPYAYGPFDPSIYNDARSLEAEGLITITRPDWGAREYRINEAGIKAAKNLDMGDAVRDTLKETVDHVRSLSFRELLSEIYRAYPKMRTRSVFR